ncbi:response regulator transcription factor [Ectobacillus antri]|uniref:Response regulator transcription factor n=1 Tax=Ectobacillus antri TaxID=2486280 RepID=A0ABT6H6Y2_9BACI|nr:MULTISPECIES: response regulator transcription factor [Ectobacillus]MDG4657799.1 response regulator transcription factor [Ectobacillus antri]MDG5754810.1 response regulator transcription factor [Ectobacillus antri]UOY92269.1 response regulator transcription factor [Ectobacillus sp. JY-23]
MIRVIIAEDQRMLRGALGALLDLENDIEVVGQAANGEEALMLIANVKPDICILDIEMPLKSGLDVAEELQKQKSTCRVVILTTFARPGYFGRAMKAGIYGYLLKDGPVEDLAVSLRNVMDGKREISQDLMFGMWQEVNPLTERERELLLFAREGKTTNEIAMLMYLSAGTVRNYMSEVLNKLHVRNRIEAIAVAEEKGWL